MNEQLAMIIDLLKAAIEVGQTVTLNADDITVSVNERGTEVTINNPNVSTES